MARRATEALRWAAQMFGDIVYDTGERALRFLEEALELVQTQGLTAERAHALVDRVYGREPGDVFKEIGQAQLTLDVLCENAGYDPYLEAEREFRRILAIPKDEWRRRQNAKAAGIARACG